jgi:hypothetical protein
MDLITITLGITTAGFALTTMIGFRAAGQWRLTADCHESDTVGAWMVCNQLKQSATDANKAYNTSQGLLSDTERNLFLATEGRERTRALMDQEVRDHSVTMDLLAKAYQSLAKHEARRAKDNAARKARHQRAKVVV